MFVFDELNKDQLSGLANLCFDLSKGSLGLIFLSVINVSDNPFLGVVRVTFGFFMGLAFTHAALILLKLKEKAK